MSGGRFLGTFQADNVVDARHVDAAATALALLTTYALDRCGRRKRRRKRDRLMVIWARCDTTWTLHGGKNEPGDRSKDQPVEGQKFRPVDAVATDLSPAREGDMSRT